jgi:hypothetical protein
MGGVGWSEGWVLGGGGQSNYHYLIVSINVKTFFFLCVLNLSFPLFLLSIEEVLLYVAEKNKIEKREL